MSPWIPITVAIAGAIVSIVAAVLSSRGATKARMSAEVLNSRAHRIARLDSESEELRDAYKAYVLEFGRFEAIQLAAPAMATLEALMACQGATAKLEEVCLRNSSAIALAAVQGIFRGIDPTQVRVEYRAAQKIIADKREAETTD